MVYPRVCGGTLGSHSPTGRCRGLSPRVRGNPPRCSSAASRCGSIPACAGEPGPVFPGRRSRWVYPRVCGGTAPGTPSGEDGTGLSPRVRGNRPAAGRVDPIRRSIPACAGEPPARPRGAPARGVYPRVCGGTVGDEVKVQAKMGLSPRVRGNPSGGFPPVSSGRSIPACAGEPPGAEPTASGFRGLSPRVRGNLTTASHWERFVRSIPACAGEPGADGGPGTGCEVYPRVCGGTCICINRSD